MTVLGSCNLKKQKPRRDRGTVVGEVRGSVGAKSSGGLWLQGHMDVWASGQCARLKGAWVGRMTANGAQNDGERTVA